MLYPSVGGYFLENTKDLIIINFAQVVLKFAVHNLKAYPETTA